LFTYEGTATVVGQGIRIIAVAEQSLQRDSVLGIVDKARNIRDLNSKEVYTPTNIVRTGDDKIIKDMLRGGSLCIDGM